MAQTRRESNMSGKPVQEEDEERQTALDFNPASLAAEVTKKGDEKPKIGLFGLQVPLPLLLILILACIIGIIVAPSSYIFVKNAHDTVDQDAKVIAQVSLNKSISDVSGLMARYRTAATNWGLRSNTIKTLTQNLDNLKSVWNTTSGKEWLKEGFDALDHFEIETLACHSNEGVGGPSVRKDPTMPNATTATVSWIPQYSSWNNVTNSWNYKFYHFSYLDQSTNYMYLANYTFNKVTPLGGYIDNPRKNFSTDKVQSSMLDTTRKPFDGQWRVTFLAEYGVAFWNFARIFFFNPAEPTKPSHVCLAGAQVDSAINPFFMANKPSENAIISFFNAETGNMLASSVPDSVKNETGKRIYQVNATSSASINYVAAFLKTKYPTWAEMRNSTFHKAKLEDGKTWYIATYELRPDNYNQFQFVIAFPRSDFFAAIDASIQRSVIVIACVSVAGMIGMSVVSLMFTLPLRTLGAKMNEVTNMKFSALEKGALDNRSFIREIATLENTFAVMVKSFAAGIRKNANLMSGKRTVMSTGPQSPGMSANPSSSVMTSGSG